MMVYCVLCAPDGPVHIFSTPEKAIAWAAADPREHVIYDYVIDHPERMEQDTH